MKSTVKRRLRGACAVLAAAAMVSAMVPTAAMAATAADRPPVTITGKTATYDGEAHGATVSTTKDGYTVYYSKSKLTASNAATKGSQEPVKKVRAGSSYVYYAVVPNSGKATAYNSKTGCYKQTVKKRSLSTVDFGAIPAQAYTGSAVKPALDITYNGNALAAGIDYKATYYSNKRVGTAKVIVSGRGNFTGTKTLCFRISKDVAPVVPDEPAASQGQTAEDIAGGVNFVVYSADDNSLNFYRRLAVPEKDSTFNGKAVTAVYSSGIGTTNFAEAFLPWRDYRNLITNSTVVDEGIAPTSIRYWWYAMSNLESLDVSKLDTSNCTVMAQVFNNDKKLVELDLHTWDTRSVAEWSYFAGSCSALTVIYAGDNWSTAAATDTGSFAFFNLTSLPNYHPAYLNIERAYYGGDGLGYLTYKAA